MSIRSFGILCGIGSIGISTVLFGFLWLKEVNFDKQFSQKILYAVDSERPVMVTKLKEAQEFLEDGNITANSGNPCVLFPSDPYCEVGEWVDNRLIASIEVLSSSKELTQADLLKIKDNLTEASDGKVDVESPKGLYSTWFMSGNTGLAFLYTWLVVGIILFATLGGAIVWFSI